MKRLLRNILKHPSSWIFLSLTAVGIAIAVPVSAPALIIAAAVGVCLAAIQFPHFIDRCLKKNRKPIEDWISQHPWQFRVAGTALILFIIALFLTIGFFTGGAGFAFMAPVFAAIATPFATAAAAGSISLFLPALAGTSFVFVPLTLGNNIKRFLAWLDSFKYDGLATTLPDTEDLSSIDWKTYRSGSEGAKIMESDYFTGVFHGIFACAKNGFSSLDQDKCEGKIVKQHDSNISLV